MARCRREKRSRSNSSDGQFIGSQQIRTRILNQSNVTYTGGPVSGMNTTDPAPSADPACTAAPAIGTKTCTPVDLPDTTVSSINRQTPPGANTNASPSRGGSLRRCDFRPDAPATSRCCGRQPERNIDHQRHGSGRRSGYTVGCAREHRLWRWFARIEHDQRHRAFARCHQPAIYIRPGLHHRSDRADCRID